MTASPPTRTPRRTSTLGHALAHLVAAPDGLTARDLGLLLYPVAPMPRPTGTLPERAAVIGAWRREWYGVPACPRLGIRATPGRVDDNARRASIVLHRLQSLGLVEPTGDADLAPWFRERVEKYGLRAALRRVGMPAGAEQVAHMLPSPVRGLRLSGAGARVKRAMVDAGVMVVPSRRVASGRGIELVAAWAAREVA